MGRPLKAPLGLGTAVKAVVHVATTPLPDRLRTVIRACPSCTGRARRLDRLVPNINPLANG